MVCDVFYMQGTEVRILFVHCGTKLQDRNQTASFFIVFSFSFLVILSNDSSAHSMFLGAHLGFPLFSRTHCLPFAYPFSLLPD